MDVLVGAQLRKLDGERHDHHIIHAIALQELYFFFDAGNQPHRLVFGIDDQTGVRVESNHDAFPINTIGQAADLLQNLLMPQMGPVEGADGHDGIAESRQIVQVIEYSHGGANVSKAK